MAGCAPTDVTGSTRGEESLPNYASDTIAQLPTGLLMTHTARSVQVFTTATHGADASSVARAMEQNRTFGARMPSRLQGIRPLITRTYAQPAMSLASWLNMRFEDRQTPAARPTTTDSYVINVDEESSPETTDTSDHESSADDRDFHRASIADNYVNSIREGTTAASANNNTNNNNNHNNNNNNNNNNNSGEDASVTMSFSSGTRDSLRALCDVLVKCLPFAIILLAKCIYDYKTSIIEFLLLLIAFTSANRVLKLEIAMQQNSSYKTLSSIIVYICGCCFVIDYIFEEPLFRMYSVPKTMSELLWSAVITDMVLKLITIALKVLVTCLPGRILPYERRGKYYLVMETSSQFYRSTATVYPWFFYLWNCYSGSKAFVAHVFVIIYTSNKFGDVVPRGKLLWSSLKKMWQNVSLGVSPSKDQLMASGSVCVICHEKYTNPVLLQCNHIFCETCVTTWLDRERTCPLCRASISDDPIYRDGYTTDFIQWY